MAKTYLDQIVDYPSLVIQKISSDKYCVGLLLNKAFDSVDENDCDEALERHIFDYQYVDETTQTSTAYIWVEMEVNDVSNTQIKNNRLYVTVSCHKEYMELDHKIFKGLSGSRRDNLTRYIDKLLNRAGGFGIGNLSLLSVRTLSPVNGFVGRELTYEMPDFNIVPITA